MASNTTPSPTTELDAVNVMLLSIGEAPVSNLDNAANMVDVALARRLLTEVSKDLQAKGFKFNSEIKYPLTIDGSGFIVLPSNTIRAPINDAQKGTLNVTVRSGKLYDVTNRTFVFTTTPVYVDLVTYLSFDDLPETARRYILIRAARQFQDKLQTSDALHTYTVQDEMEAKSTFEEYDAEEAGYNIFNNYDVYRTIDRNGSNTWLG